MRKIIDRLMARQMKLMASLGEASSRSKSIEETQPIQAARRLIVLDTGAEAAARDAAMTHLESGDLGLARQVLEPFLHAGRDVQTLTTLARICTDQGDFALALSALQRAETMNPADRKVWRLTAKLLSTQQRFREEVVYRRRLALADPEAPAQAQVDLLRALLNSIDKKGKHASPAELRLILARCEASADIDDALRVKVAGLYYLLSAGAPEALRLYNAGMPCKPDEHDVTAQLMSLTAWSSQCHLPMPRLNDEGVPGRRPTVHELEDVLVFPGLSWIPVLQGGRVLASGYPIDGSISRSISKTSPLMLYRGSHAELRLPRDMPTEKGPALLLGGSASYYESMLLYVGGLAIAEAVGIDRNTPLVITVDETPFQQELLGLLGYGDNVFIRVAADRPVCFRRLSVPSRLAIGAEWIDPFIARWYRTRLAPPRAARSKLYVAGSSAGSVKIANEHAVAALLASLGYERLDASTLSVREQIERFSGASHLVGATSEPLTNMLFAAAGTAVLELRATHWVSSGGRLHFDVLAKACGHRYAAIESMRAAPDGSDSTPIVVDVDRMRSELEHAA